MERKIIIAGSGGQGILYLGKALAFAAMLDGREVTWFPSYGAEMRGGTANCTVIISDTMIGSPVVSTPDILVAMNQASLEKFRPRLGRRGLLFLDSSLIPEPGPTEGARCVAVPATEIARRSGNTRSANMVMLGALIAKTGILSRTSAQRVCEAGKKAGGAGGSNVNLITIMKGMDYIDHKKSKDPRS